MSYIKKGSVKPIKKFVPPLTMPPTTTEQEDMVTAGQRRVNLIWEMTQAVVAISITAVFLYSAVEGIKSAELNAAFFTVIAVYLTRTNHDKVGGVGKKPLVERRGG